MKNSELKRRFDCNYKQILIIKLVKRIINIIEKAIDEGDQRGLYQLQPQQQNLRDGFKNITLINPWACLDSGWAPILQMLRYEIWPKHE